MKTPGGLILNMLIFASINVYSQGIKQLDKPTKEDFTSSSIKQPIILLQNSKVSYTYEAMPARAGAKDEYFKLSSENYVRINASILDSSKTYFLTPLYDGSKPVIRSIRVFTIDIGDITAKKVKDNKFKLFADDIGYLIDLTELITDSQMIIDIVFTQTIESKKSLSFYLDKHKIYREFNIEIDIPQIYIYDIISNTKCLSFQLKDGPTSGIIGYRPTDNSGGLTSEWFIDYFKGKGSIQRYNPVYCETKSYIFKLKPECKNHLYNDSQPILTLDLKDLKEIEEGK